MKAKIITIATILMLALVVSAATVAYLSNSVSATVTTASPIQLSATALDASGNPVDLSTISVFSNESFTLTLSAQNLSSVNQNGKYTLVFAPGMVLNSLTVNGVDQGITAASGEQTTVDIVSAGIVPTATETMVVIITPSNNAPGAYSISSTYNVI